MNMPRAQRPEWFRRIVLVLCAVLMALVSLEFAVRASTWGYLFVYPNFVLTARTVLAERDGGRYVHDPELGHVPAPRSRPTACAAPASRSRGRPS